MTTDQAFPRPDAYLWKLTDMKERDVARKVLQMLVDDGVLNATVDVEKDLIYIYPKK